MLDTFGNVPPMSWH